MTAFTACPRLTWSSSQYSANLAVSHCAVTRSGVSWTVHKDCMHPQLGERDGSFW